MGKDCHKCKKKFENREYLTCIACFNSFHVHCASVSTKRLFNAMKPSSKANWKCDPCTKNPRKKITTSINDKTSASTINHNKLTDVVTTPPLHTINSSGLPHQICNIHASSTEKQVTSTPQAPNENLGKNISYEKINIPTSNSFESLISNDELFEDIDGSTVESINNTLNRSCPNLYKVKDDDTARELKLRNEELEKRLQISDKLYNDLLLETGNLKKKISEYEIKINRLTTICTSTSKKTHSVKKQKTNTKKLNFTKDIISHGTSNIENDGYITAEQLEIIDDEHGIDKTPITTETQDKPKVCIISANNKNKILTTADRIISDEFSIIHYLKPRGNTMYLMNEIDKHLTGFTKRDFGIVFLSEEDFNQTNDYFSLISGLKEKLLNITYTNVILVLPTYKFGEGFNIYNWRVSTFNNLLWFDNEAHRYAYILDSNSNLKHNCSMFNEYKGTLNNFGLNLIFNDLVEFMTLISCYCSSELTVKNSETLTLDGSKNNNSSIVDFNDAELKSSNDNDFFRV